MRLGNRRKTKTSSYLYSRTVTVNFFRLCWAVLLIWGELGAFFWSLSSCRWPDFNISSEKPTRVLLISDPQVRAPSILRQESFWSSYLGRFIFHLNLKKSWHVTTRIRPHVVIFLGDMLANGKSVKDEVEYQRYFQAFHSIFSLDPSISVHHIPGNNDIGMGVASSSSKSIRAHYSKTFGPFNQQLDIRNHRFILLDAPGLVDEDYQRSAYGVGFDQWLAIPDGTVSFVKAVDPDERPLILLSHIPLSRPDSASCGPLREKGAIRRGVGHGYQNTLGKQTTAFLLKSLRPSTIFSGDNRDYCEYTHTNKNKSTTDSSEDIREVTVKSFSMANHIRRPGFHLLSLIDPSTTRTSTQKSFSDTACLLPDQSSIYFSLYLPFIILNIIVLLLLSLHRNRQRRIPPIAPLSLSPQSSGRSTPLLHPESAVWSPYTPAEPTSPRSTLPSFLRTPNAAAGPTFRASRPVTPNGSPLLAPMIYAPEEDDDSMYPMQYATRRESYPHDDEFLPDHNSIASEPHFSHFESAPGLKQGGNRGWSWSWSFVFQGRRRRMSIKASTFTYNSFLRVGSLWARGDTDPLLRRRGVLYTVLVDGLNILWTTVIVWILLAWWMF